MTYSLVDDSFIEKLKASEKARGEWLFLEIHPEFPGQWRVHCYDPHYYFDFKELIGTYRIVSPSTLQEFIDLADKLEYKVAFFDNPEDILDAYEGLNKVPDVSVKSSFEGTINGLLPYQVQGYNLLKDIPAGVAQWDTGTGKTLIAIALLKHYLRLEAFDTAFVVVKAGNKVDMQRKLSSFGGLEAEITPDLKKKRLELYQGLTGANQILVCNYENFREDLDDILPLFEGTRVLTFWDEAPTKLKTRTTALYKAIKYCLYNDKRAGIDVAKQRPSWLCQYLLSATPIENSPEDFYNVVRLMDPSIYGTVEEFRREFVESFDYFDENKPDKWHRLDKMGLKAAHITHQIDKTDPDIAKQFPQVVEENYYVEWNPADRKVYNEILKRGKGNVNPLALITLLQMVCDEPTILRDSAAIYKAYAESYDAWADNQEGKGPIREGSETAIGLIDGIDLSNSHHGKQDALQELICEKHQGEKTLIFSAQNETLLPTLETLLTKWEVPFVRYTGKQAEKDRFMEDPNCHVFLSSDMGSDSLDLYVGQNVINYNLPWKWSTKIQRQNRIHRASSTHAWNRVYTLMYENSIEERKAQIIDKKKSFHDGVFKGTIKDRSTSARMTKEDLEYVLG